MMKKYCLVFWVGLQLLTPNVCLGQSSCVKLPSTDVAIASMPALANAGGVELPSWAKALSVDLPHTTAAMLELDYKFRSMPSERLARISLARLAVSQTNHCKYGIAFAESDLKRAGKQHWNAVSSQDLTILPELERDIFLFAAQMTTAARDVSDEQMKSLLNRLGEEEIVGLVLYIGYSNLMDRFANALNLEVEDGLSLQPMDLHFVESTMNGRNTPSALREDLKLNVDAKAVADPLVDSWSDLGIDQIRSKLAFQKERSPRIRVPDWEEIQPKLPDGLYPRKLRIRWSRVVVGYQPVIGPAWIKCLRVFGQEAHQDQVFEESVFWVVTRGLKCFYCMGHCEMLMEVGGLNASQIEERTRLLATGEWASFSAQEQAAFHFATKLTYNPSEMTCNDFQVLARTLGQQRAMDCLWWVCRCHLMTKVSDAFQLQLERENVFMD